MLTLRHRKDIGATPPFYPRKDIYFRDLVLFSNDFLVDSHLTGNLVCFFHLLLYSFLFYSARSLFILYCSRFYFILFCLYGRRCIQDLDKYMVSMMRLDDWYLTALLYTISLTFSSICLSLNVCNIFHLATFQNIYCI